MNINQQSCEKDKQNVPGESPEPGSQKTTEEKLREDNQLGERDSDVEGDVVPIVIRPGHIRFEPLKKGLKLSVLSSFYVAKRVLYSYHKAVNTPFSHVTNQHVFCSRRF